MLVPKKLLHLKKLQYEMKDLRITLSKIFRLSPNRGSIDVRSFAAAEKDKTNANGAGVVQEVKKNNSVTMLVRYWSTVLGDKKNA